MLISLQAEGLTAIEAWMLACILFVFAALAEYAALLAHKSKVRLPRGDELITPTGVDEWGVVRLVIELRKEGRG